MKVDQFLKFQRVTKKNRGDNSGLKENQQYILPAGLFDNEDEFIFDHQVFIDCKPSFYNFANKTNDMTEAEVFAKYAPSNE